ncbi:aspartate 1-decarboxylase [Clostridium fungisolvens]|uniref:Aspartate 1-decarboxylase n=1 Tax=Clostridium fungisolvens TaxID=1604897 RepID=A0A6V8SFY4_9CLOT|nr:aspartate 1-decarboxylase [Clostridium fungisolvens]GFP76087.1 Aspartate 1-decarboxylase [Clostridium fungisolvens]
MILNMLKSKIHRATVTQAELNYVGSITIDKVLMEAAGIHEYEKVAIADIDNGQRLETYVIAGEPNSGVICLNGAAARCVQKGDKVIIMCYCQLDENEIKEHKPTVVFVNDDNSILNVGNYEKHGEISDKYLNE